LRVNARNERSAAGGKTATGGANRFVRIPTLTLDSRSGGRARDAWQGSPNVLIGGNANSIILQPLSVQGKTGLNVGAGGLSLTDRLCLTKRKRENSAIMPGFSYVERLVSESNSDWPKSATRRLRLNVSSGPLNQSFGSSILRRWCGAGEMRACRRPTSSSHLSKRIIHTQQR